MTTEIDKIAQDLCLNGGHCRTCSASTDFECQYKRIAKVIYDKEYKTVPHGRWHAASKANGEYGWYCSLCGAGFLGANAELIAKDHRFCPKCGAIME